MTGFLPVVLHNWGGSIQLRAAPCLDTPTKCPYFVTCRKKRESQAIVEKKSMES